MVRLAPSEAEQLRRALQKTAIPSSGIVIPAKRESSDFRVAAMIRPESKATGFPFEGMTA